MIKRQLERILKQRIQQYPVVVITGPRQSGKTTLSKMSFPELPYANLEHPETRDYAKNDPNQFLKDFKNGIIDEFQRVPELASYIQVVVDESGAAGQYILTGSQQFEAMQQVSQSLAGRVALLKLLPLGMQELYPKPDTSVINHILYHGFYPRIFDKQLNPTHAYSYYFQTYIERDVRNILNIKNLRLFEIFVKLCAGRTGQLLNLRGLANECGVSYHTISEWVSVLEASYIIHILRPHHNNFGKRLTKSPKLYFLDAGLCCYLMGIQQPEQLDIHPLRGALFETMVVSELLKQRVHQGSEPNLYFWRAPGIEVDILLDFGTDVLPVEIKSGTTIQPLFFKGLKAYRKINPGEGKTALIYGGDSYFRQKECQIVGLNRIGEFSRVDYKLEFMEK